MKYTLILRCHVALDDVLQNYIRFEKNALREINWEF